MANKADNVSEFLVVSNPIAHSRSPEIHAAFAGETGVDMRYDKALVERNDFERFADEFAARGGRGMNVTLPFKVDAYRYVSQADPIAAGAQAVNTIAFDTDGTSRGSNTDGGGLMRDLKGRHGQDLAGRTVLLLGAGGAAQGVVEPLLADGPARLVVANRTLAKAEALIQHVGVRDLHGHAGRCELSACDLNAVAAAPGWRADLIVNATSFGHEQDQALPLDADWVGDAFCYDMTYGAGAVFYRWAADLRQGGCADGLGMLVEQAALSFEIWHGVLASTDPVYAQLRGQT